MLRPDKQIPETEKEYRTRDPLEDHNYIKKDTNNNNEDENDSITLENFLECIDNDKKLEENVNSKNCIETKIEFCLKHEQNEHSDIQENVFDNGYIMADVNHMNEDKANITHCEHDTKFENRVNLIVNVKVEHEDLDIKPEMIQCTKCSNTFIYENDMIDHFNTVHGSPECVKQHLGNNKISTKSETITEEIETNIKCGSTLLTGIISVNDFIDITVDETDTSEQDDWHITEENITKNYFMKERNQTLTQSGIEECTLVNFDDSSLKETKNVENCEVDNNVETSYALENSPEFKCNDCSSSFVNKNDMMQHIRVLHGSVSRFKKSLYADNYLKKTDDKTKNDPNAVPYEENTSLLLRMLLKDNDTSLDGNHITPNDNESEIPMQQRFNCTICDKDYSYKYWSTHLKEVHGQGQHTCTKCHQKFKCKRYLKRHIMYRHEGVLKSCDKKKVTKSEAFKCALCPKVLTSQSALYQHINNCHATQAECEICHSVLKSKSYLNAHMRRVHYDGRRHGCKICFKELKSPRQLSIHTRYNHPETLIPCSFCKRSFFKVWQLTAHMKHCTTYKESVKNKESSTYEDRIVDVD